MPIDQAVKALAYMIDPQCWKSYSGKAKQYKQRMDSRRTAALAQAQKELELHRDIEKAWRATLTPPMEHHMTPLHILIGIHYASRVCPYSESEPEHRYSKAVRSYTWDLVRAGLLTPREPDGDSVPEHVRNTAEYAPTDGLRMWVDALMTVPLPKLRTAWTHPMLSSEAVL